MTENKPQILLLCLAYREDLDETYHLLFSRLSHVANVKRAEDTTTALREMAENIFKAIIITDEALADFRNLETRECWTKLRIAFRTVGLP